MRIGEILANQQSNNSSKKSIDELELIINDLQTKLSLSEKEEKTFRYYLEKYKKNKNIKKASEIINELLKDKNEKTINIKGRIVAELKKNLSIVEEKKCNTTLKEVIPTGYLPVFSCSSDRAIAIEKDEDGLPRIRKYESENKSISHYNIDLNIFDRFVFIALCSMYAERGANGKIKFSLREICDRLKISGDRTKEIVKSIECLGMAFFREENYLHGRTDSQRNFSLIMDSSTFGEIEKTNTKKCEVFLHEYVVKSIEEGKMKFTQRRFSFKKKVTLGLYCYLDNLSHSRSRKCLQIKLSSLLEGLAIDLNILSETNRLKKMSKKIKKAIEELKEDEFLKDFKIEGRGKTKKYTFYF